MEPRAPEGPQIIVTGLGVVGLVVIALGAVIVRKIRGPLTAAELAALSRPALDGSRRLRCQKIAPPCDLFAAPRSNPCGFSSRKIARWRMDDRDDPGGCGRKLLLAGKQGMVT